MLSQNRGSLLNYAVSRLTPEIFSHPVWLRFGKENTSLKLQIAHDLFLAAKTLQDEEPGIACQILLLCAVYQNNAAQSAEAIRTAQQVQHLARHARLDKEMIWAMWGEAAIYIHQGNHEQACAILLDLQVALSGQNEWMLAGFIDILSQDFCKSTTDRHVAGSQQLYDQQSGELQTFTFEWLQQWGCSIKSTEVELESLSNPFAGHQATYIASIQSFLSIQKWLGRWQSFKLAIQGELKLQWTAKHVQPIKEPDSLWSIKEDSPELLPAVQILDLPAKAQSYETQNNILISSIEHSPSQIEAPKRTPALGNGKVNKKQQPKQENTTIPVAVHMLGNFTLTIGEKTVKLPPSRGLSVLKYLLLHHERNITREVLMDTFWPDAGVETARNNLNVALHSLRKSLRDTVSLPVIKFEDGAYALEPNLQLWLDIDEFQKCVNAGQQLEARDKLTEAVAEYEAAISLYQGDLLEQNPYDDWTVLDRERLRIVYLETLDRLSQIYFSQERYTACRTVCQLILVRDRCREDAHCLLMRCYSRQGQNHLALRQYQVCMEALRSELDVEPELATVQLADRIRRHEQI